MKKYIIITLLFVLAINSQAVLAQCAMCKATLEGNSDAQHIAKGLNSGILYLAAIPYILFSIIGYYWYKNSRKNKKTDLQSFQK